MKRISTNRPGVFRVYIALNRFDSLLLLPFVEFSECILSNDVSKNVTERFSPRIFADSSRYLFFRRKGKRNFVEESGRLESDKHGYGRSVK